MCPWIAFLLAVYSAAARAGEVGQAAAVAALKEGHNGY